MQPEAAKEPEVKETRTERKKTYVKYVGYSGSVIDSETGDVFKKGEERASSQAQIKRLRTVVPAKDLKVREGA